MAGPPDRVPVRAIVLLGLMGAGKTSVGRIVADRLGWPLDDSDPQIRARTGRTVKELRDEIGTDGMHTLEAEHLLLALAAPRPRVITPSAWSIEDPACRAALGEPGLLVAWLRADPEALAARFADAAHRPAYGDDPATFLAAQLARRGPLYAQVADLILDTAAGGPERAAEAILAAVAARDGAV